MRNTLLRVIILLLSFLIFETSNATTNEVRALNLDADSLVFLISVQEGDLEKVKHIVSENVDLNVTDTYGRTALHIAAEFGHTDIIRILIESGADLEARTGRALHTYFGYSPLMSAAHWGNAEAVDLLVKEGANINAFTTSESDRDPTPVLSIAILEGRIAVVEQLVGYGADVNAVSKNLSYSPLFLATRFEHFELVKVLIKNGSQVNAVDFESKSLLHAAAVTGNVEIADYLIDNGAKINMKSTGGRVPGETPLHVAAFTGQLEFAMLLVRHNADVNATSHSGYTPLRRAVDGRNPAMAKFLIDKKAEVGISDSYGVNVLHIVAETDMISLAEEFINLGVDVNSRDKASGFTPLDYAQDGEPEMLNLLEINGGICTSC